MGGAAATIVLASAAGGAAADRLGLMKWLDKFLPRQTVTQDEVQSMKLLKEENVVIEVAENVSPSVVTVGIKKTQSSRLFDFETDPFFDPFGIFRRIPRAGQQERLIEQDIGSGFVISEDGLIATNKHVVSDTDAGYNVVTKDDKTYDVEKIYRDPVNDLAILKVSATGLKPVEMGDSSKLKVGQFVVAIGTALGEFRHTVTTGVISGLGRGITAGSPFEAAAERLDNVIQTDAAINPGNSGGPLLNSSGQVIGVNTAVASGAENISFALPINLVKDALDNFRKTGSFDRAFLGVSYRMVTRQLSIMNNIPEGAFVLELVEGSSADDAGIQREDIITHFDAQRIQGDDGLAQLINKKKIGDRVVVRIWRDRKEKELTVQLGEYTQ